VARHQIEMDEAHEIMEALTVGLVRDTYNLGTPAEA
jgi:hypothetical protein